MLVERVSQGERGLEGGVDVVGGVRVRELRIVCIQMHWGLADVV